MNDHIIYVCARVLCVCVCYATTMAASGAPTSNVLITVDITSPLADHKHIEVDRDLTAPPPPELVDDTPYSYEYTGKHDSGPLPPIRTDNMYGHLLDALKEAKASTDAQLVNLVTLEAGMRPSPAPKVCVATAHSPSKHRPPYYVRLTLAEVVCCRRHGLLKMMAVTGKRVVMVKEARSYNMIIVHKSKIRMRIDKPAIFLFKALFSFTAMEING